MNQPRKHHYLPQFYLRGFSTDGRSLFQIEKATAKFYRGQIEDLAAIRDFHEIDADDTADPQSLEKKIAQVEAEHASQLREVLCDGFQNRVHRAHIIQFLAMMRMRVPAVKAHIDNSYQFFVRATAKKLERAGKLPKPPPGLEEQLRVDNLKISISNWKVLEKMFSLAANPQSLEILYQMKATILRAPFGASYLTSDQPVSLYHPRAPAQSLGVGPATPGVVVSLPLSSRVLLLLDDERGPNSDRLATSGEVAEFNRRTIAMAKDYIFAGEDIDRTVSAVKEGSAVYAGFTFDNLATDKEFLQVQRFVPVGPPPHS